MLKPLRGVEQQHHDFGEIDRAARHRRPKAFPAFRPLAPSCACRRCRSGGSRASRRSCGSVHCQSTAIESRVIPASGPVSSRSSPSRRLISVDLPALGRPTMASFSGPAGDLLVHRSSPRFRTLRSYRSACSPMIGNSAPNRSAMPSPCSADSGTRVAEAEGVAFEHAAFARRAFGLVGDQHHRHVLFAQPAADFLVQRGQPGARVDHEQRGVRAFEADLGLRAHPPGQAVRRPRPPTRRYRPR